MIESSGFGVSVAIAIPDPRLREVAYQALRTTAVRLVGDLSDSRDIPELVAETGRALPDILLLGLPALPVDAMEAVRQVCAIEGGPSVIAVSDSADPQIILSAMRAGASEFLYPPLGAQFEEAMVRVAGKCAQDRVNQRSQGAVFAFVSAKGGCGATTLACHTAAYLYGKTKKQVLLADLDFCSGIAALTMQATPRYNVMDAVENLHRLDLTLWKSLVTSTPGGVDLICPPPEPMDPMPQVRALSRLLAFWRSQYDFIVLDLGHGLTPLTCALLESIDSLLLITTEETAALRLARQMLRNVAKINCGRNRLKLVLNQMQQRPSLAPAELERMMDNPFFGVTPYDRRALEEAYAKGRFASAESRWGVSVAGMAGKLAGLPHEAKKVFRFSFLG